VEGSSRYAGRAWRLCAAVLVSAILASGCGGSGGGGSLTLPSTGTQPGSGLTLPTTGETTTAPPETTTGKVQSTSQQSSTNWALIAGIAAVVIVLCLVAWMIARRRGARGGFRLAVNDIYAEGVTLHDRLATLGPQPGAAVMGVDASLDKLSSDVRRIQPDAPTDDARAALDDLSRDLLAIRSAVSAIETTGAAAATVDLQARLASLRASLDRLLAAR
jgi:hypothetical protein